MAQQAGLGGLMAGNLAPDQQIDPNIVAQILAAYQQQQRPQ
jgi:hypothetical protein